MVHEMRLVDFAFNEIKNDNKDIEVRLYDEKRQQIHVGDIILFHHIDTDEILRVKVLALHIFDTFDELFKAFDKRRLGLKETDDASIMNNFYTIEEQEKYKAVGIEIVSI